MPHPRVNADYPRNPPRLPICRGREGGCKRASENPSSHLVTPFDSSPRTRGYLIAMHTHPLSSSAIRAPLLRHPCMGRRATAAPARHPPHIAHAQHVVDQQAPLPPASATASAAAAAADIATQDGSRAGSLAAPAPPASGAITAPALPSSSVLTCRTMTLPAEVRVAG